MRRRTMMLLDEAFLDGLKEASMLRLHNLRIEMLQHPEHLEAIDAEVKERLNLDWTDKTCQEAYGMIGEEHVRCGKEALMLVKHAGRHEGPDFMCLMHGIHNVNHRGGICLVSKVRHVDG
jgi:hypothetical protein